MQIEIRAKATPAGFTFIGPIKVKPKKKGAKTYTTRTGLAPFEGPGL